MKKLKNKILMFAFAFVILFSTTCMANSIVPGEHAKTVEGTNEVANEASNETSNEVTAEDVILASDYFTTGQDFELNKLVDGNSFAIGNTVNVTGQINGDLFVLGNKVVIDQNAIIYNNLFVLAQELVVNGTVYNLYSLSTNLTVGESAIIYRDMASYSNKVTIQGRVQRNASIMTNELSFPDNSRTLIYGSLNYSSVNEASIPEGVIQGDVNYTKINTTISTEQLVLNYIVKFIATAIFVLVVVLFLMFFAPKTVDRAKYNLMERPFATTGVGILGIVLVPFIVVLLMTLTVALPLACVLAVIYGVLVSLGFSFFAIAIAKSLVDKFKLEKKWQLALFTVISALVMYAITIIPAIGGYAKLFFIVVGFGIVLVSIFSKKFEKTDKKAKKTEKVDASTSGSSNETPAKKETKEAKKAEKKEKASKKNKKADK